MNHKLAAARNFFEKHQYQEAQKICDEILSTGARNCILLHLTANCCIQMNRLQEAKEFLHQASVYDPVNEIVWLDIGKVCSKLRTFEEGLEAYSNALEINPQSASALNGLAVITAHLGNNDLSAQHIELAYQIDPENSKIKSNREKILKICNRRNSEMQ